MSNICSIKIKKKGYYQMNNFKDLYKILVDRKYNNFLVNGVHCKKLCSYNPYTLMFWKDWFTPVTLGNDMQIVDGIKNITVEKKCYDGLLDKVITFIIHWNNGTKSEIAAWRDCLYEPRLIKPHENESIESLLCNTKGFNKSDCYFDEKGNALLGINMFAFDFSSYSKKEIREFVDSLILLNGENNLPLLHTMKNHHVVPTLIVGDKDITIELLNADTAEQLTYGHKALHIDIKKKNKIHTFKAMFKKSLEKAYNNLGLI